MYEMNASISYHFYPQCTVLIGLQRLQIHALLSFAGKKTASQISRARYLQTMYTTERVPIEMSMAFAFLGVFVAIEVEILLLRFTWHRRPDVVDSFFIAIYAWR